MTRPDSVFKRQMRNRRYYEKKIKPLNAMIRQFQIKERTQQLLHNQEVVMEIPFRTLSISEVVHHGSLSDSNSHDPNQVQTPIEPGISITYNYHYHYM